MLNIVLLGLNHKTAPVEIRENFAFSADETGKALKELYDLPEIQEVLIISTCNRVEILLTSSNIKDAVKSIKTYFSNSRGISISDFDRYIYIHEQDDAVRHVFRVASSLDSMMVGEPQILGQIKDAYKQASTAKSSGVLLNRLMHRTFFVAKRVRSETGIGDSAVSISYAACELAKKIFGSFEDKKVLLVGAGEMAELAVEHLIRNNIGSLVVANRTFEKGIGLAKRYKGNAVSFEEITDTLQKVDIIISSTGSPEYVIRRNTVKTVMKNRRKQPLFFIDIAVPRDIDPEINRIRNAYVYDIDDLKGVIKNNLEQRNKEAAKGERLIDESVIGFRHWYNSLEVVPTIIDLREKLEKIAEKETKKSIHSLKNLDKEDHAALKKMTDSIINKILHNPTLFLKSSDFHGNKSVYLDVIRRLFKLDE